MPALRTVIREPNPELESLIAAAFPVEPVPNETEITSNNCRCDQCAPLVPFLNGYKWTELPPENIDELYADMCHLSEVAFGYYVPAFIRYAYSTCDPSDDAWVVSGWFEPHGLPAEPSNFSAGQRLAVFKFLIWLGETFEEERALEYAPLWNI